MIRQQNYKKSAKDRDYAFTKNNHTYKRCVKVINQSIDETSYYNTFYHINRGHLKINAGIIKMVCEPLNKCKTGTSSKDGCEYEFKCIGKDNIPTNCDIIKSSDVSEGLTNDEKIMNQKKS
ncbi:unnamed protein product [Pocillopora meandrina]|uniref:Uncharacterized protein n=1 Tax=Pocillopora meandrina TaxID=46732 RepID=A0AAU9X4P4_9CNID|nr:unnamed protein product [Pocillopora meandrina]